MIYPEIGNSEDYLICDHCGLIIEPQDFTWDEDLGYYHKGCLEEIESYIDAELISRDLIGF